MDRTAVDKTNQGGGHYKGEHVHMNTLQKEKSLSKICNHTKRFPLHVT